MSKSFFSSVKNEIVKVKSLKKLYYQFLKPHEYLAYLDYEHTDERLKMVHILEAINYSRVALLPSVYFEFGCYSARTFSAAIRAATHLKMDGAQFYAFDSFEGLPQTDVKEDGYFEKGTYATPVDEFKKRVHKFSGKTLDDQHIVKGFYSDSLTKELQASMPKVGVVHIDVDLYSSTKDVLEFIKPLLVLGTVLLFDDYYSFPPDGLKGEMRALKEFCNDNPGFQVKEWKAYSTFGQSFFITACP